MTCFERNSRVVLWAVAYSSVNPVVDLSPQPPPPHFPRSWSLAHVNECLSFTVGLWTQMPNNSLEVWRADGQVQCLNSTFISVSIQIRSCQVSAFVSVSFGFIIVEEGRLCPSLRLVRLQSDYSWGTINSLTYWRFQRGPFFPPWNPVRRFHGLWFGPAWL